MEPTPAPLLDHFDELDDPRIDRTKLHSLTEILFITIAGSVAGADGWRELETFGHAKKDWLARYLPLPNGIPSDDTFRRVITRLDPVVFETCFREWMAAAVSHSGGALISIDGKTLRGSYDRTNERAPLHMVSVWAEANRLVLAQEPVEDHSSEITAIPKVLEILGMRGCIVTIDAMGTQREIAEQTRCEQTKWQGLRSIAMVESMRIVGGEASLQRRYYITSLASEAKWIACAVRSHWSVENRLHWVLDMTFGEDSSRPGAEAYAPENLGLLRRIALNLLRQQPSKGSLKGKRKRAGWDNTYLSTVLGFR